ncbi:MAG: ArnT family glycosyltransferase [Chitinophagaceae bacterium]
MVNINFSSLKFHRLKLLPALIIVVYLFNAIQYSQVQSITSDEGSFYDYAAKYLKGNPARTNPRSDNSKMPVVILNTIPRVIKQILYPQYKSTDGGTHDIMQGRYITVFVSVFSLLIVYVWAAELYGSAAGIFAIFLMAFCPNNLANATLVTTDSYSVLFLLATMYCLWKFCKHKSFKYFLLFSLLMALDQLVKQSLFHLYILAPLILVVYYFVNRSGFHFYSLLKYLLLFVIINWFVINAGYYFFESNQTLASYHFMSELFQNVQKKFPSWLPVPFPKPFIDGLDMAKYYDQIGGGYDGLSSFGKVTILDKSATGAGLQSL